MFKNQKGITLIALVITIIVLLILAGITIALITSNDSAPNKAGEAKIMQDVGAAKDAVAINAANLMTTYYENKYVKDTASSTRDAFPGVTVSVDTLKTNIGTNVRANVTAATVTNGAYSKAGTILIESKESRAKDGKVYAQLGTIAEGGTISWTNPTDSDNGWQTATLTD